MSIMLKTVVRKLTSRKMRGQLRHMTTALGVALVSFGVVDEQAMLAALGAITAIGAFAASWVAPEKSSTVHDE